jgi:hypothetical protein
MLPIPFSNLKKTTFAKNVLHWAEEKLFTIALTPSSGAQQLK